MKQKFHYNKYYILFFLKNYFILFSPNILFSSNLCFLERYINIAEYRYKQGIYQYDTRVSTIKKNIYTKETNDKLKVSQRMQVLINKLRKMMISIATNFKSNVNTLKKNNILIEVIINEISAALTQIISLNNIIGSKLNKRQWNKFEANDDNANNYALGDFGAYVGSFLSSLV